MIVEIVFGILIFALLLVTVVGLASLVFILLSILNDEEIKKEIEKSEKKNRRKR